MKRTSKKIFKYNSFFYIAALCAVVILAVYFLVNFLKFVETQNKPTGAPPANNFQTETELHKESISSAVSVYSGSIYDPKRITFQADHFDKTGYETLQFKVFDKEGNPYTPDNLLTTHEMKMHFFTVSADFHEFQHVHPAYENGMWKVPVNFPIPGTYYVYVDIVPVQGSAFVLRGNLVVQQETAGPIEYPPATADFSVMNRGYKAALTVVLSEVLKLSELSYTVTKDGKPTPISQYLAATAHFFILRQGDPDSIMHIHPHTTDADQGKASFSIVFRQAGRYTVFAQFGLGPEVYTFPITFDINSQN